MSYYKCNFIQNFFTGFLTFLSEWELVFKKTNIEYLRSVSVLTHSIIFENKIENKHSILVSYPTKLFYKNIDLLTKTKNQKNIIFPSGSNISHSLKSIWINSIVQRKLILNLTHDGKVIRNFKLRASLVYRTLQ